MKASEAITIELIENENDCETVRQLLRNFLSWHFSRHTADKDLISEYFDKKTFDAELNQLPGSYVYPYGALLLAYYNDKPAGCVALKKLDNESCEMKRMFVDEQFHGKGVGKKLASAIVARAKDLGFKKMKLDTSIRQIEAQKLYEGIGFKRCEPYYELPKRLRDWLVFMEKSL